MTELNGAASSSSSDDRSPVLSQCTRNGISQPCKVCGNLTPVRMKRGDRYWIRCYMCKHDGPNALDIDEAIKLWNAD